MSACPPSRDEIEEILEKLSTDPSIEAMLQEWEGYELWELEAHVEIMGRPGDNELDAEEAAQVRAWLGKHHGAEGERLWDQARRQPPARKKTEAERAHRRLVMRRLLGGEIDDATAIRLLQEGQPPAVVEDLA